MRRLLSIIICLVISGALAQAQSPLFRLPYLSQDPVHFNPAFSGTTGLLRGTAMGAASEFPSTAGMAAFSLDGQLPLKRREKASQNMLFVYPRMFPTASITGRQYVIPDGQGGDAFSMTEGTVSLGSRFYLPNGRNDHQTRKGGFVAATKKSSRMFFDFNVDYTVFQGGLRNNATSVFNSNIEFLQDMNGFQVSPVSAGLAREGGGTWGLGFLGFFRLPETDGELHTDGIPSYVQIGYRKTLQSVENLSFTYHDMTTFHVDAHVKMSFFGKLFGLEQAIRSLSLTASYLSLQQNNETSAFPVLLGLNQADYMLGRQDRLAFTFHYLPESGRGAELGTELIFNNSAGLTKLGQAEQFKATIYGAIRFAVKDKASSQPFKKDAHYRDFWIFLALNFNTDRFRNIDVNGDRPATFTIGLRYDIWNTRRSKSTK